MAISPNDFSLWARLTGNKYPSTPAERAKKGPEVHNFIQNLGKEGMLGGKEAEEPKKERNLGEKIATGALIAGGVAAAVAAGRDPRVQNVARRAGSTAKDKVGDFLRNIGGPRVIDRDVVDASYDITPNPREQQSNVALTQKSLPEGPSLLQRIEQKRAEMVDSFKPAVTGETFQTSGAISGDNIYGDIGDAKLRARRTFGPTIDALKEIDPGRKDLGRMGSQMLRQAEQDRDFDLAYIIARNKGLDDTNAVRLARETAGFENMDAITGVRKSVGKPTEYRELLGTLKTSSPIKPRVDELLNLVETGPQIILPEKAQKMNDGSSAIVLAGGGNNTNVIPTVGATIGGSSLTDKHATKMAVDNALDNVRAELTGTPGPITGVTSTGLKTFVQDDNLRRIAPTPEQAQAIREEPGRVSRTFDEMTGFTAPKSESISTNPLEERISRLEGKTAELRAVQENLSRAGELMSAGLDPRTTRFDSARAAGLTSKSGIKPRITNPRFQENVNLGKVQEAAIPESSGRVFFEQDSEGRVIPETVERRSERKVVRGPDTKTRSVAGGYVGMEGQSGSVIGPYGIEASDSPKADITKRPTDTGGKQSFSKRPPSANPVESFDVANELRKIQTDQSISPEERRSRSKDFLKQKMSERGISAMGESEPLRKR